MSGNEQFPDHIERRMTLGPIPKFGPFQPRISPEELEQLSVFEDSELKMVKPPLMGMSKLMQGEEWLLERVATLWGVLRNMERKEIERQDALRGGISKGVWYVVLLIISNVTAAILTAVALKIYPSMNVVAFTISEFRRMKLEDSEKIQLPPKVLVVDDNEDFNHVFSDILTSAGCEVKQRQTWTRRLQT